MISWITVIAWIQTCREAAAAWFAEFRRNVLYPFAAGAGRDMLLLRNDQWVDASVVVPVEDVTHRYSAVKHTIVTVPQAEGARSARWPWISVAYGDQDISDFFQGLRLPSVGSISNSTVLMLFAHQRGVLPTGELQVVTRDGDEETVYAFRQPRTTASESEASASVNYIR
jgi:hypothetical protein